jgi:DNA-3-methyladenine glycosylase II
MVGQVISVRAAIEVYGRLAEQLGGTVTAEALAQADEAELRTVGLTAAKARALHELGIEIATGAFSFAELERLEDAEAEARLVALRGVGPWSAQMFLLRSLGRPDVFPAGDLGLRRGIQLLDARPGLPSIPDAAQRALPWRPYRSYAAKYLWLHYVEAGSARARR